MQQKLTDYIRNHQVACVVIKASALSQGKTKLAHLEAAELRGMAMAAAAMAKVPVRMQRKAAISKSFGSRKADEYLKDDGFWAGNTTGAKLRSGSREAALIILAERGT